MAGSDHVLQKQKSLWAVKKEPFAGIKKDCDYIVHEMEHALLN